MAGQESRGPQCCSVTALLTLKINMVKVGQGPHLNTVSEMLQDASKTGVELRLVLPTLGRGRSSSHPWL